MQNIIKYSGLKNLSDEEQSALKNIIEKEFPKIQRLMKNASDLNVNIKTLKKDKRKRFIISMKLDAPGKIFTVKNKDTERGGDWDLIKSTHKELDSLYFEIKHSLKTDTEPWKKGGIKALFRKFI